MVIDFHFILYKFVVSTFLSINWHQLYNKKHEINFNKIFYLAQHIQNVTISACN